MTSTRLAVAGLWLVAAAGMALVIVGLGSPDVDQSAPVPAGGGFTGAQAVADPEHLPTATPVGAAADRDTGATPGPDSRDATATEGDAADPTYDRPDHVWIPSLGIDAPVSTERILDRELTIPGDPSLIGRWQDGADVDADAGTVLLAGHVSFGDLGRGALFTLHQVQPGAVVVLTDGQGRPTAWRITSLRLHDKDALPGDLFTTSGPRQLALVTCGGDLIEEDGRQTYAQNVVAMAEPVALGG